MFCFRGITFPFCYFNKVMEKHEIHAAILLTEVPLTFGAAITKLRFQYQTELRSVKSVSMQ